MRKFFVATLTIIAIALIVGVVFYVVKSGKIKLPQKPGDSSAVSESLDSTQNLSGDVILSPDFPSLEGEVHESIIYDDFQIHFMMLGNDKAGDSIYVKAGDIDIVIDAGSRQSSTKTTKEYINQYCSDNKLEYVILTHGDQDHVEGFTDTNSNKGILSSYEIETIIDSKYTTKTTAVYSKYITLRDNLVKNGTKYFTAGDCWLNVNGATRSFTLTENVTMDILYNYYYFDNNGDGKGDTNDENDYSVCTMFTYEREDLKKYFLLTGDLEEKGEEKLAEYYDGSTSEKTLPQVDLYKAGHHGSKTSSNDCLLDIIKPKMSVVSCCCGVNEYTPIVDNQFPTQAFISRISKWTDLVYVTTMFESYEILTAGSKVNSKGETVSAVTAVQIGEEYLATTGFKPMNGNIIVSSGIANGIKGLGLYCSNSYIKLKNSEWFNTNITLNGISRPMRVWPEGMNL